MHSDGSWWLSSLPPHGLPVHHPLPHSVDVVVIGAGLSGCAAALRLAELGLRVCVLEARQVSGGACGRNGGLLSATPTEDAVGVFERAAVLELLAVARAKLGLRCGEGFDLQERGCAHASFAAGEGAGCCEWAPEEHEGEPQEQEEREEEPEEEGWRPDGDASCWQGAWTADEGNAGGATHLRLLGYGCAGLRRMPGGSGAPGA